MGWSVAPEEAWDHVVWMVWSSVGVGWGGGGVVGWDWGFGLRLRLGLGLDVWVGWVGYGCKGRSSSVVSPWSRTFGTRRVTAPTVSNEYEFPSITSRPIRIPGSSAPSMEALSSYSMARLRLRVFVVWFFPPLVLVCLCSLEWLVETPYNSEKSALGLS